MFYKFLTQLYERNVSPRLAGAIRNELSTVANLHPICLLNILSSKNYWGMNQINERDETLMSICAETKGCFELDPGSSEPNENCVFAMLIQAVYTSSSLTSADEKGHHFYGFSTPRGLPRHGHGSCHKQNAARLSGTSGNRPKV